MTGIHVIYAWEWQINGFCIKNFEPRFGKRYISGASEAPQGWSSRDLFFPHSVKKEFQLIFSREEAVLIATWYMYYLYCPQVLVTQYKFNNQRLMTKRQ